MVQSFMGVCHGGRIYDREVWDKDKIRFRRAPVEPVWCDRGRLRLAQFSPNPIKRPAGGAVRLVMATSKHDIPVS
jgi:hypothetical protein